MKRVLFLIIFIVVLSGCKTHKFHFESEDDQHRREEGHHAYQATKIIEHRARKRRREVKNAENDRQESKENEINAKNAKKKKTRKHRARGEYHFFH